MRSAQGTSKKTGPPRGELLLVIGLATLAAVAHAVNMFDNPAPTLADDEGTYVQQAWAVVREGLLSPYTYTYDHVPGGWLQIAAWLNAVGPGAFASVTATARVFMLVVHVASVVLLYPAARGLGIGRGGATVGCLIFAASPLALFYSREVILDNVMVFWLIASLALVLNVRGPYGLLLGGIALGIAVISKEPALVLLPAYAFVAMRAGSSGRTLVRDIAMLLGPALAIAALYPAYALAHGELWPSGAVSLKATDPRAYAGSSLVDSWLWQLGRPGGNPLDSTSELHVALGDWIRRDTLLVVGGVAAALRNTFHRGWSMPVGILGAVAFGFLVRGGIVFPFHIAFAVPFLALNLAVAADEGTARLPARWLAAPLRPLGAVALLFASWVASGALPELYLDRPGEASRAAVAWMKASLPADSVIIGRDDFWADLHEPDGLGRSFVSYYSHWRLAYDDDARQTALVSGWRSVNYLVVSTSLVEALRKTTHDRELSEALRNATLLEQWVAPTRDRALHPPQIIEVWAVDEAGVAEHLRTLCSEISSLRCPGAARSSGLTGR